MLKTFGDGVIKELPCYINYKKWFKDAPDNAKYVYYQGTSLTESNIAYTLGRVVLQDAFKGEIILFQRRTSIKNYPFDYIAIRRRKVPRRLIPNKLSEQTPMEIT